MRTERYVDQYGLHSKGIWISRLQLSDWNFLRIPILPPPLAEQEYIAYYLDKKTEQIDKAIAQKEQMIELLKERKQILINRAVTRGLNPDVPLKDSSVDWIGEIPEHWDVRRLKYCANVNVSNVDKHSRKLEDEVKLCNYVDVYKNDFILEDINFMKSTATEDDIRKYSLKLGDVIITKDSEDWKDIGVPALVRHEEKNLICGYHLAILRSKKDKVTGDYLFQLLQSLKIKIQFNVRANGVTRYGISYGAISGAWVLLPPVIEQKEIADYVEYNTAKIDKAIFQKQEEIERLKEYKSTLIDSAVTGKICLVN